MAKSVTLTIAFAVSVWITPGLAAPPNFDGAWSVSIVTDSGDCGRSFRYAVQISNGRVFYQGDPSVNIAGRVDPHGRVAVAVRAGDQVADGNGRLSRNSGGGRWVGRSPGARCSGHWVAERRS
jgi:hypothetical protein